MSIQNARFLGNYTPPKGSAHYARVKRIYRGTDSENGREVHYYEKTGRMIRISPDEWPKWKVQLSR